MFYSNSRSNIYEYLYANNIKNISCFIISVLEDNWIIKLLFKDDIKQSYNKLYQESKQHTNHLLIANRIIL